jgi:hypothetical protein
VARQGEEVGIDPPVRCHNTTVTTGFIDVPHRLKPVDSNSVPARQQENRVEVHGSQTG